MHLNGYLFLRTRLMTMLLVLGQPYFALISSLSFPRTITRKFSRLRPNDFLSHRTVNKHKKNGLASSISNLEGIEADDMGHLRHLMGENSKIDRYWIRQLSMLPHGTARDLIPQLIPDNFIGYEGVTGPAKKGTLTEFYVKQKKEHPDKVILMRVGEFYETFGVDAVMLVAYCGLNTMAGKARAGCPISNVQALLNKLTDQGLTVAVYEEKSNHNIDPVLDLKKGLKSRSLSQIVFPGNRVYAHDLSLRVDNIDFPENYPVVGILNTLGGYTVCQVYLDEQVIDVSERLTLEAVKTLLAISHYAEPIYIGHNNDRDQSVGKDILGPNAVFKSISVSSEMNFPDIVVRTIASNIGNQFDQFRTRTKSYNDGPRPVYISTASQIGLMGNPNVPALVDSLLPSARSLLSARFLSKWISSPPTHALAGHMRALCSHLMTADIALPQCGTLKVKKVVSLLYAKQGNVALFRDIKGNVAGVLKMLIATKSSWNDSCDGLVSNGRIEEIENPEYYPLLPHLLAIVTSETGEQTLSQELAHACQRVLDTIDYVIAGDAEAAADVVRDASGLVIPIEFFNRNEDPFRGKLSRNSPVVDAIYCEVEAAAANLIAAIREDYPIDGVIKYDFINNMVYMSDLEKKVAKRKTKEAPVNVLSLDYAEGSEDSDTEEESPAIKESGRSRVEVTAAPTPKGVFIRPEDRKGKPIPKKFTTQKVADSISSYLDVTEKALHVTTRVFEVLSADLYKDVIGIKQAATWGVVLKAAADHTAASKQKDWCIPTLMDFEERAIGEVTSSEKALGSGSGSGSGCAARMILKGLSPYWIRRSSATLNDVELQGLFLLTAPNMSGKSTLMRSVLVAALLANCGLFVPCSEAQVPRYDHFFLRTASHDVPIEKKSAFALEMDDVRIILKDATSRSLIMIDELGKGTSARDGSALAGALLENLEEKQVAGIFATHLHELFFLPLALPNTKFKRMGSETRIDGRLKWTYKLEDGTCTNSHALETALEYGIDESIILRARQLGRDFDARCRPLEDSGPKTLDSACDTLSLSTPDSRTNSRSSSIAAGPVGSNPVSVPVSRTGNRNPYVYDVDDVSIIFNELIREQLPAGTPLMTVRSGYDSPVSYEGNSCVYVLILQRDFFPDSLYVGETESIQQRLKQHRATFKGEGVHISACIASAANKSSARHIETLMQSKLSGLGYALESISDSTHSLFSTGR